MDRHHHDDMLTERKFRIMESGAAFAVNADPVRHDKPGTVTLTADDGSKLTLEWTAPKRVLDGEQVPIAYALFGDLVRRYVHR